MRILSKSFNRGHLIFRFLNLPPRISLKISNENKNKYSKLPYFCRCCYTLPATLQTPLYRWMHHQTINHSNQWRCRQNRRSLIIIEANRIIKNKLELHLYAWSDGFNAVRRTHVALQYCHYKEEQKIERRKEKNHGELLLYARTAMTKILCIYWKMEVKKSISLKVVKDAQLKFIHRKESPVQRSLVYYNEKHFGWPGQEGVQI